MPNPPSLQRGAKSIFVTVITVSVITVSPIGILIWTCWPLPQLIVVQSAQLSSQLLNRATTVETPAATRGTTFRGHAFARRPNLSLPLAPALQRATVLIHLAFCWATVIHQGVFAVCSSRRASGASSPRARPRPREARANPRATRARRASWTMAGSGVMSAKLCWILN